MTGTAAAAAAAAMLALAAPASMQSSGAFAGLPDVAFTYYDVDGQDAGAVRAAMNAARPTDGNDGQGVDALSHWSMTWRWRGGRQGECDLSSAGVTISAEVTLPRLAHPERTPAPLLERWTRYRVALEAHEAGHVRYAFDHRADVLAAIRGATCATAAAAAGAALAAIRAHEVEYDRETRHGQAQGAVFP